MLESFIRLNHIASHAVEKSLQEEPIIGVSSHGEPIIGDSSYKDVVVEDFFIENAAEDGFSGILTLKQRSQYWYGDLYQLLGGTAL